MALYCELLAIYLLKCSYGQSSHLCNIVRNTFIGLSNIFLNSSMVATSQSVSGLQLLEHFHFNGSFGEFVTLTNLDTTHLPSCLTGMTECNGKCKYVAS